MGLLYLYIRVDVINSSCFSLSYSNDWIIFYYLVQTRIPSSEIGRFLPESWADIGLLSLTIRRLSWRNHLHRDTKVVVVSPRLTRTIMWTGFCVADDGARTRHGKYRSKLSCPSVYLSWNLGNESHKVFASNYFNRFAVFLVLFSLFIWSKIRMLVLEAWINTSPDIQSILF